MFSHVYWLFSLLEKMGTGTASREYGAFITTWHVWEYLQTCMLGLMHKDSLQMGLLQEAAENRPLTHEQWVGVQT